MKFLDFVAIFFTTDIIFMCLSDNILPTGLDILNNKQKQKYEAKYFSEQDANGMDQVSTDMTEISNAEISSTTVNSRIRSIQFIAKQNISKANEESNIFTKSWNTLEISSNFSSKRNLKNSNFSHSDIDTKSLTCESSENNSSPKMKVESKFRNNCVEAKLFGKTKHQEQNKPLDEDSSMVSTETALPDFWYNKKERKYIKGNFSCSIQQYEDVSISCSNISMYEISVFLPTDTVTLAISNCLQVILSKPLFPHLKKLRSLKLTNNHHRYITRAFMGLESLEELDLSRNNIIVVKHAFTYIPMLKSLNLTHNSVIRIETIASGLKTLTHFENLTLDENTDITRILKNDLVPLKNTKLTYLSLFNTTIEIIEKNAFDCLPYLKILDLSVNYVNEIAMANVTSSLNNTSIKFLFMRNLVLLNSFPYDALKFLQNTTIFRLDLAYNYFPAVEIFPYIPTLESLWLPRCSVQDIKSGAFKNLPNLKELVLNNHELREFPSEIARTTNLEILDLNNQISMSRLIFDIKDFIFVNMTQLEQLNLAHVSLDPILSRYAFFGLYSLKLLTLGDTMLEAIHEYAFETLASLLVLDLQGNNLRFLKNYTFSGLQNLRHLYLSR
ncbi:Insulin-like growth factor-binding protein complex acid labile subunit, partial [Stegodyphus mimosarum]